MLFYFLIITATILTTTESLMNKLTHQGRKSYLLTRIPLLMDGYQFIWPERGARRPARCLVECACVAMLLYMVSIPVSASTLVSGNASGTWTKTGSPYMVIDNCTVPGDQTLTIQAGATVIIGEGLKLVVNGQILANGTASDGITFKATTTSNYWDRIAVNANGKADSQFSYCNISNADYGLVLSTATTAMPLPLTKIDPAVLMRSDPPGERRGRISFQGGEF
jgi:hypothetical protein